MWAIRSFAGYELIEMAQFWFVAVGLLVGVALFGRPRRLESTSTGEVTVPGRSPVRIVVPARNEAASLANLLDDLAIGRPDGADVVVVDDRSTDETGDIARSYPFVTVVRSEEPPPGWRGKPWACSIGAGRVPELPDPEVLVFLDADVRVVPGALDELLAERRAGGVVSVQPFHRPEGTVEQLSAVFNVVSMMGIGAGGDRPTGMFGPVVCCTAAEYRSVGGHASVRSAVTEDVALARRFIEHNVPLRVRLGGDRISFRMYPTGFAALVEGWTKNMATGAGTISLTRSLAVAWWVSAMVSAAGLVFDAAQGQLGAPGAVTYVLAVATLWWMLRRVGGFQWWVPVLFPVPLAFFVVVFVRSVWFTYVRRSVTWRGRTIDLSDPTAHDAAVETP